MIKEKFHDGVKMNWILSILTLLLSSNAFALGPIPNGTYTGTETCNGSSYSTILILTDNTMKWDDQVNAFDFGPDSSGFIDVRAVSSMTGSGQGHSSANGLHDDFTFD